MPDPGTTKHWTFHACGLSDVADGDEWMSAWERQRISPMRYPKRRLESRLGRWTAKQTIGTALGLPVAEWATADPAALARISIENQPSGAPTALVDGHVAGVEISMTDRADWAVCVTTAPGARSHPIGCDLELVEPRSDRFVADWFTEVEQTAVGNDRTLRPNLIWSAKESALKVIRTGLRRDTRSVEIALSAETGDGWSAFVADIAPLGDGGDARAAHGWWRQFGAFVLTCATTHEIPPPAPLHDPSPLTSAAPSHRWLNDN
ncbi:MAG: 4'-phosphopantetheinyl transferase superfamily protein [Actinomycetota bacterium]